MKRLSNMLTVLQVPVDFFAIVGAGATAYLLRFTNWAQQIKPVEFDLTFDGFMSIMIWVALAWLIVFALSGLYRTDPNKKLATDLVRILFACSTGVAAVAVYILFTQQLFDSRFLIAVGWVLSVFYVGLGHMLMRGVKALLFRAGVGLRRVVIIGNDSVAKTIEQTMKQRKELGFKVVKTFARFNAETEKALSKMKFEELLFANPRAHESEALRAIDFASRKHIVFKYSADVFATYSSNMVIHPVGGVPIVELRRTSIGLWGRLAKRVFDVLFSAIVLVVMSPFLLVVALIIFIETGRPIIYKNERVGAEGRLFFTYKFRSMYQKDSTGKQFGKDGAAAEKREEELIKKQNSRKGPIYKIANDPRVTPFGRFMRRWSLDELPQFFNVLAGEMSIVGPRPHQPREVAKYKDDYPLVFSLLPGITGLAQISGRSDLSFEEEMKLDVLYIERWGLMLDIIIVIKTPFLLLKRRKVL